MGFYLLYLCIYRKTKKVHADDNDDDNDNGHRVIASHTHSLSVTIYVFRKESVHF